MCLNMTKLRNYSNLKEINKKNEGIFLKPFVENKYKVFPG